MNSLAQTLFSNPLFSSIVTVYTLILLYFPRFFLHIIFSPVLTSTSILLLTLLRLGAIQRTTQNKSEKQIQIQTENELNSAESSPTPLPVQQPQNENESNPAELSPTRLPAEQPQQLPGNDSRWEGSFVEWDVRAPLEVIYEGEGEGNDDVSEEKRDQQMAVIERYASLSLYYPESDTDSSWEGDEEWELRWGEEEREGLIEIELDCEIDDDNLIEIDPSPARFPES